MALSAPKKAAHTERNPRVWAAKGGATPTISAWEGAVVGRYPSGTNQGYVDNIGADPTLIVVGVTRHNLGVVPAGHVANFQPQAFVDEIIWPMIFPNGDATTAVRNQLVYGIDENNASFAPVGPPIGAFWEADSATSGRVGIGPSYVALALSAGAVTKPVARAVITAIGAYTYANGTITANATNETLTADSLTKVAGDVYWLPPHVAAADADVGLYILTTDTGASAKFVLTRHPFMPHGAAFASGVVIEVGGEGSSVPNMAGSEWKSMGAAGTVGTSNLGFWPRSQSWEALTLAGNPSIYTLGTGGGGEKIYLRATTRAIVATQNTAGGTLGTNRLQVPVASRVAGNVGGATNGSAVVVIASLVDAGTGATADTSSVDVSWTNW